VGKKRDGGSVYRLKDLRYLEPAAWCGFCLDAELKNKSLMIIYEELEI
jgi:hypothetical protein